MLTFAIAAKLPAKKKLDVSFKENEKEIAVFIPAYKEDQVILEVARSAVNHNYARHDVYVIADSLKASTLFELRKMDLTVIEVFFEKSTKAKALNKALALVSEKTTKSYDIAVVLDADNMMEDGFLAKMNEAYNQGFLVVQGQRIAKNMDSQFAILDGLSEAINNNIYNLGQVRIGFSARLVGSGMAFNYDLFQKLMGSVEAIGGFDKELELKLLEQGHYIHYLPDAIVLDEKVSKAAVFGKQRQRWIAAQYFYLRAYASTSCKALVLKGEIDFFNKIIQMALPPRLLLTAFLGLGCLIHLFCIEQLWWLWSVGFLSNVIANTISIPRSMYKLKTLWALLQLPKAILIVFFSMFKLGKANKKFLHTPHG